MTEASVDNHYVSYLIPSLKKHSDALVFRPYIGHDDSWDKVTYRELEQQLAVAQAHWRKTLSHLGLKPLDVVGFWLTGRKLSDLVNGIAVSALGYTPQFFGGLFGNSSVIFNLLEQSGSRVLVVDASHLPDVPDVDAPFTSLVALEEGDLLELIKESTAAGITPEFQVVSPVRRDDVAVLFHSSGTTGGLPKIIPNTFKMMQSVVLLKFPKAESSLEPGRQHVWNTLGNLAHIGSFHCFVAAVAMGACIAQTSSMAISSRELVGLTRECGLSTLVLYATFLSDLIRAAQKNEDVKHALQSIDRIPHTGVALNKDDEEWAYANGLKIMTAYGTTETGPMLRSKIGFDQESRVLRQIEGANAVFLPHGEQDHGSAGPQLFELVVPSDADDAPPTTFCGVDGYYHTNDLFEKVGSGWVYRGRAGDWIKLLDGFCDTKNIEDSVRSACSELIHDAVVVGSGRVLPCLIVEVVDEGLDDAKRKDIAQLIIERTADFSKSLFPHERIQDPKRIFVVGKGTLPRTKEKGNVRRVATEEMFAEELDCVSPRA